MVRQSRKAIDWAQVESGVESDLVRADLKRVLAKQRKTGKPTDEQILNALRDREQHERMMRELREILAQGCPTPLATLRKWRSLMDWGLRCFARKSPDGGVRIDLKQSVLAHRLFGADKKGASSPDLLWANHVQSLTASLWPQIHEAGLDPKSLHRLRQDVDAMLSGEAVDVARSHRDLDLVLRELETRAEQGPPPAAAEDAKTLERGLRQQKESMMRAHAESPEGRMILRELLKHDEVKTAVLKRVALADAENRAEAKGEFDDTSHAKQGRKIEETLRVMRDRCSKDAGCGPCTEHLGLISPPTRGIYVLTDRGRELAVKQKSQTRRGT